MRVCVEDEAGSPRSHALPLMRTRHLRPTLRLRSTAMCVIIVTFAVISTTISSPVLVKMLEDAVTYLFGGTDLKGRLGAHSRLTALLAQPGTLRHNRWSSHSALPPHRIFALGPATSPHLHLCADALLPLVGLGAIVPPEKMVVTLKVRTGSTSFR